VSRAWVDGALVAPERAALALEDPGCSGDGLVETMRAEGGVVLGLERHLERLAASARTLGLAVAPGAATLGEAVRATVEANPAPALRIRLVVTALPTVAVQARPVSSALAGEEPPARAVGVRGAWCADAWIAEHKTLSRAGERAAARRARAAGADRALLLDGEGRLGEADGANVFAVLGGQPVTAPIRGLLPGLTRAALVAALDAREAVLAEEEWRAAEEMFLTSAVRGVVPLTAWDGRPAPAGAPGPVTRRAIAAWRDLVARRSAA
jgi:branched-chain amino acid aminotransferase